MVWPANPQPSELDCVLTLSPEGFSGKTANADFLFEHRPKFRLDFIFLKETGLMRAQHDILKEFAVPRIRGTGFCQSASEGIDSF
jgi:hypothetical protein